VRPKKTGRTQTGVSILTGITKSQDRAEFVALPTECWWVCMWWLCDCSINHILVVLILIVLMQRKKKLRFSCIHRSVIFYPKSTKFAVEVPAYNRKQHSKVEVNCASHLWSKFRFLFFIFLSSYSFFLHKHKKKSNSGMHILIKLKFGTRAE